MTVQIKVRNSILTQNNPIVLQLNPLHAFPYMSGLLQACVQMKWRCTVQTFHLQSHKILWVTCAFLFLAMFSDFNSWNKCFNKDKISLMCWPYIIFHIQKKQPVKHLHVPFLQLKLAAQSLRTSRSFMFSPGPHHQQEPQAFSWLVQMPTSLYMWLQEADPENCTKDLWKHEVSRWLGGCPEPLSGWNSWLQKQQLQGFSPVSLRWVYCSIHRSWRVSSFRLYPRGYLGSALGRLLNAKIPKTPNKKYLKKQIGPFIDFKISK